MVLNGDVTPVLNKNYSAVEMSHKTLKMDEILKRQSSNNYPNNMRYGNNETQSDMLELMSPKESPDLNNHTKKLSRYPEMHNQMQEDKIKELQREVMMLKEKLAKYETNCRCNIQKTDVSVETELIHLENKEVSIIKSTKILEF